MQKKFVALVIGLLCLQPFGMALAGDEKLLALEVEIHVDGERVASPRIVLEPGGDGSIIQGMDNDLVMKVVFHSTHIQESGAGVLMDVDFGLREPEHLEAHHVTMPWDEPFEFVFSTALDGPSIRLVITPSRVARSDLMLWPEKAGK